MLGDVLLIKEKHEVVARDIVERIVPDLGQRPTIGISGESGSGKSEVAHLIAKYMKDLGIRAKILHTDNYYRSLPEERMALREGTNFQEIGYDEYDWVLLERNMKDFCEGRRSQMPCVDIVTDQVDQLTTDFGGISCLILEGLYAIRPDLDFRIFIDLTYHQTKKAQILRGKEPQSEERLKVLEGEHRAVRELKSLADLTIDSSYQLVG